MLGSRISLGFCVLNPHRVFYSHKVPGPRRALGPFKVLGPSRVLDPLRVLGPYRVLDPYRVLGPYRVLVPHRVLGPRSCHGPGSCSVRYPFENQNCTENQSIYLFLLYFSVISCRCETCLIDFISLRLKAIRYENRAELFVLKGNKRPIRYEFQNGVKPNRYNGNIRSR